MRSSWLSADQLKTSTNQIQLLLIRFQLSCPRLSFVVALVLDCCCHLGYTVFVLRPDMLGTRPIRCMEAAINILCCQTVSLSFVLCRVCCFYVGYTVPFASVLVCVIAACWSSCKCCTLSRTNPSAPASSTRCRKWSRACRRAGCGWT